MRKKSAKRSSRNQNTQKQGSEGTQETTANETGESLRSVKEQTDTSTRVGKKEALTSDLMALPGISAIKKKQIKEIIDRHL